MRVDNACTLCECWHQDTVCERKPPILITGWEDLVQKTKKTHTSAGLSEQHARARPVLGWRDEHRVHLRALDV